MSKVVKFSANRVWRTYVGGKQLDIMAGKESPADTHFPEDWIGSTVEAKNVGREHISEGLAFVEDTCGNKVAFRDLVAQEQIKYLGEEGGEPRSIDDIPLVKYLDSATRLHFQAHPTCEFAQQRLNSPRGKTEAYVILAIRDDITEPYIYAGFQRSPSREQLKQWIETQDIAAIEQCFDPIPVKPGDVFLIPGGRPHALGEGILMLEIMEPSDLAVRFEFERCGYQIPEAARFMGRGIETALDVFNLDPVPPQSVDDEFRCLPRVLNTSGSSQLELLIGKAKTPCFTIKRATVCGEYPRSESAFFIGVVVAGKGTLKIEGEIVALNLWDRFFCPADVGDFVYESDADSNMVIIECYPGGS